MTNTAPMTSSFDARLASAHESSARYKEAARDLGGVLTGIGEKLRKTSIGVSLAALTALLANTAFDIHPAQATEPTSISLPVAPPNVPYKIVQLSRADCIATLGFATDHLNAEKPDALSKIFVQSMVNFMMPDSKTATCTGIAKGSDAPIIIVQTTRDLAVWESIEDSGRRQHVDVARAVNVVPASQGSDPILPKALLARAKALAGEAKLSQATIK